MKEANDIWRDRGAAGYQYRSPYAIRMSLGVLGVVVLVVWVALSLAPSEPNEIPQEFLEGMARDLSETPLEENE